MKKGKLYLVPTPIGGSDLEMSVPSGIRPVISGLSHFIVEEIRTARRFLKQVDKTIDIDKLTFYVLNEHTRQEEAAEFLAPLLNGHDTVLVSEAGSPCVADPGSMVVREAHAAGIEVIPVAGPSSILLALMASGFNGQHFIFHGYLPLDKKQRSTKIREMENDATRYDQTQIFMETPYRNDQLLHSILQACRGETRLCIAASLMDQGQFIKTSSIAEWKEGIPSINKKPAIFLIGK